MIHVPRDRVVPPATLSSAAARAARTRATKFFRLAGTEELLGGEG